MAVDRSGAGNLRAIGFAGEAGTGAIDNGDADCEVGGEDGGKVEDERSAEDGDSRGAEAK